MGGCCNYQVIDVQTSSKAQRIQRFNFSLIWHINHVINISIKNGQGGKASHWLSLAMRR